MNKFKAPLDGYYKISADIITCEPTGEFEWVNNPEWNWWTFWIPRTVRQEKYHIRTEHTGEQIRYLEKGVEIDSNSVPIRIGG